MTAFNEPPESEHVTRHGGQRTVFNEPPESEQAGRLSQRTLASLSRLAPTCGDNGSINQTKEKHYEDARQLGTIP